MHKEKILQKRDIPIIILMEIIYSLIFYHYNSIYPIYHLRTLFFIDIGIILTVFIKDLFDLKYPEGKQNRLKYFDHKFIALTVGISTLYLITSPTLSNLYIFVLFFGILGTMDFFIDLFTDIR